MRLSEMTGSTAMRLMNTWEGVSPSISAVGSHWKSAGGAGRQGRRQAGEQVSRQAGGQAGKVGGYAHQPQPAAM